MAWVDPDCNDIVAHLRGVKDAVGEEAGEIATRARRVLAQHHYTGASRIVVTTQDTDRIVWLVDRAALSIEFGHTTRHGRDVEGVHALGRAVDSMPTL